MQCIIQLHIRKPHDSLNSMLPRVWSDPKTPRNCGCLQSQRNPTNLKDTHDRGAKGETRRRDSEVSACTIATPYAVGAREIFSARRHSCKTSDVSTCSSKITLNSCQSYIRDLWSRHETVLRGLRERVADGRSVAGKSEGGWLRKSGRRMLVRSPVTMRVGGGGLLGGWFSQRGRWQADGRHQGLHYASESG